MTHRILQWVKLICAVLYVWNQSTAFITLLPSKLEYYVTHSRKFNILIFNHRDVKARTERRRETVPDMTKALLSRKPQALSLRDSLHNNHISINGNKNNNKHDKKKELPKRSWRCQSNAVKLNAWTEDWVRRWSARQDSRVKIVSVSLYFTSQMCARALPFAYFYSTVMFLAGCHVWPQLGRVTREREELKEEIHLTG